MSLCAPFRLRSYVFMPQIPEPQQLDNGFKKQSLVWEDALQYSKGENNLNCSLAKALYLLIGFVVS